MTCDLDGLRDFDTELLSSRAKAKCESMSCFSSALSLSHTELHEGSGSRPQVAMQCVK